MDIVKSTGIALSSQVYGESDIACNYYTRDSGKRTFVFKGLKKSGRRSRAATEPGAISSIVYYYRDGRDSFIVSQCDVEKYYSSITESLEKIFHLYFILESVEKTCGYNMADPELYALLHSGLDALSRTDHPSHLALFFLLRLLMGHGVLSDIESCKVCGAREFGEFMLDTGDCRPVCSACADRHHRHAARRTPRLAAGMRDCMRRYLAEKFAAVPHSGYPVNDVLDALFNLSLFVEDYFHTELKTKSFIFSERFR